MTVDLDSWQCLYAWLALMVIGTSERLRFVCPHVEKCGLAAKRMLRFS